jgi:hypothetical protein
MLSLRYPFTVLFQPIKIIERGSYDTWIIFSCWFKQLKRSIGCSFKLILKVGDCERTTDYRPRICCLNLTPLFAWFVFLLCRLMSGSFIIDSSTPTLMINKWTPDTNLDLVKWSWLHLWLIIYNIWRSLNVSICMDTNTSVYHLILFAQKYVFSETHLILQ